MRHHVLIRILCDGMIPGKCKPLFAVNIQMAYMSSPFGQGMFYVKGVAPPEVSMMDIAKSVWPFWGIQFVCLMIVVFNPQIALWFPGTMIGK